MSDALAARRLEVAKQLVAVGKGFNRFLYQDEQRPSRAVERTMQQAEQAFADEQYDHAEHLANVVVYMIERDAPIFAADPKKWIAKREELGI